MNAETTCSPHCLALAHAMADAAAEVIRHWFRKRIAVDAKADASPVTIADRETEQFLRDEITRLFPADTIVGEEFGETPGTASSSSRGAALSSSAALRLATTSRGSNAGAVRVAPSEPAAGAPEAAVRLGRPRHCGDRHGTLDMSADRSQP